MLLGLLPLPPAPPHTRAESRENGNEATGDHDSGKGTTEIVMPLPLLSLTAVDVDEAGAPGVAAGVQLVAETGGGVYAEVVSVGGRAEDVWAS